MLAPAEKKKTVRILHFIYTKHKDVCFLTNLAMTVVKVIIAVLIVNLKVPFDAV